MPLARFGGDLRTAPLVGTGGSEGHEKVTTRSAVDANSLGGALIDRLGELPGSNAGRYLRNTTPLSFTTTARAHSKFPGCVQGRASLAPHGGSRSAERRSEPAK